MAAGPVGIPLITLDTSAIYALLDRRDPDHASIADALGADGGPFVVPAMILAEIGYLAEARLGAAALDALLDDVQAGSYSLDFDGNDIARIRHLVSRYADLPLGFADAAVVACAERNGRKVLTLDRDFGIVAAEGTIEVFP
jgi:uncharacterized protein